MAELQLEIPVAPGGEVDVRMTWTARVARTYARTGRGGNFYFLAHWFPKFGVLEEGGWNGYQFHASTEFFSNFGLYAVNLTVPDGWVVGATGVELERRSNEDGTATVRFEQADVHQSAWTTSPAYLVRWSTFSHSGLPEVRLRLLLEPEHEEQKARHFDAARAAPRYYGDWIGPYPYGHLTIVDARWRWDGRGTWTHFNTIRPSPAVRAAVDPDRVLLLDVTAANNSAVLSCSAAQSSRSWALVRPISLQDHLTYGFLV